MKKVLNKVLYALLWTVWYVLSLLPLWFHYLMADVMYLLLAYVVRYRRKVILKNLQNAYPDKSRRECVGIMKSYYHFFADYLAETLKFGTMSVESMKRHMKFTGTEQIVDIVNEGQSVALFLGHYGNWEWVTSLACWFAGAKNADFGHIYHPLEDEVINRLFLSFRNRTGSISIPMHETLRWLIEHKRDNRSTIVGYIADQVPTWENIHHWLTFFNQETPVFTGMERIARKFNQAVFYVDVRCVRRGYYECDCQLITREPCSLPDNEITNECFRRLEKTINRAPQYWLRSHNRWKRTREEFDRRFEVVNDRVIERKAQS